MSNTKHVIILGGGFAGLNCAHKLTANKNVHVTLIDRNNYHEFTPLLYQVAASALAPTAAAVAFRRYFASKSNIDIKMARATSVDPKNISVLTEEGQTYSGDYLVLAAGSYVNFFKTPGAEEFSFPLYTLCDARRLRSRLIGAFESADRNPNLIHEGVLNFVIVGAGPTGTEIAGALADMLHVALPREFKDLMIKNAKIYLINHEPSVLEPFSKESQRYAEEILQKRGVQLLMGTDVVKVTDAGVELSNREILLSKTVIWAGGLKASDLAGHSSFTQGHAGRIITRPDLTVEGFPTIYALGDLAILCDSKGKPLPQLASVAKQSGEWAAKNILAHIDGKPMTSFEYDDKGILAMIGKNAAIAELGKKRHELKGFFAYLTWLGVHVALLPTFFQKLQALIGWSLNYFGRPAFQILDYKDQAQIKESQSGSGQKAQKAKDSAEG